MLPLKSLGPDGFSVCFYQKYWAIVGDELYAAVLSCLNSRQLIETINDTFIALIPKVKNPLWVIDFKPISLCNVVYKLLSKVLANRLKIIILDIISPNQSAFIFGLLVTDNVIAAYEALHTINIQLKGKVGYMAMKLDISKAYY